MSSNSSTFTGRIPANNISFADKETDIDQPFKYDNIEETQIMLAISTSGKGKR